MRKLFLAAAFVLAAFPVFAQWGPRAYQVKIDSQNFTNFLHPSFTNLQEVLDYLNSSLSTNPASYLTVGDLSSVVGSGLGVTSNKIVVTNAPGVFQDLSAFRVVLGGSRTDNEVGPYFIHTSSVGAVLSGKVDPGGSFRVYPFSYGSRVSGYSETSGDAQILSNNYGAQINGFLQGETYINPQSHGAEQAGSFAGGNVIVGSRNSGSSQRGAFSGVDTKSILADSPGASQQGSFSGSLVVGTNAPGALQVGFLPSGSANNSAAGAVQLLGGAGDYLTDRSATGSLLLGPGTQTNAYGILASGPIQTKVRFIGDGSGITNAPYLPLAGGTMSGTLDMGDFGIDAVSGIEFSTNAQIDMEARVIGGALPWIFQLQPAIPGYLTSTGAAAAYLPLTGGTITGNLDLGGNTLLNVDFITTGFRGFNFSGANEGEIEGLWEFMEQPIIPGYLTSTGAAATYLPLSGGTMSGSINMGEEKITNVGIIGRFPGSDEYIDFETGEIFGDNWYFYSQPAIPGYLTSTGAAATYLPVSGGSVSGIVEISGIDVAPGSNLFIRAGNRIGFPGGPGGSVYINPGTDGFNNWGNVYITNNLVVQRIDGVLGLNAGGDLTIQGGNSNPDKVGGNLLLGGGKPSGTVATNGEVVLLTALNAGGYSVTNIGLLQGNAAGLTNFPAEALTGNRFSLGTSNLTNIQTGAVGAFEAHHYQGSSGAPVIESLSHGATRFGFSSAGGLRSPAIKGASYGSVQRGQFFNSPTIDSSIGSEQAGRLSAFIIITNSAGAMQRGDIDASAKIQNAPGALQLGKMASGSLPNPSVENNGIGAIQTFNFAASSGLVGLITTNAYGSILLGPGTNDVAYSVKAAGGFYGDAIGLTNFPSSVAVFVDPPTSNTAPGSAGQIAYDNTNFFLYNVASSKWLKVNGVLEW